jgi:hypothetical protein
MNVAKERELYTFVQDGRSNREMETSLFSKIDGDTLPVFEKLNATTSSSSLLVNREEAEILIGSAAYQFVRTPAFRDMRARSTGHATSTARALTPEQIHKLRTEIIPPGIVPPGVANTDSEFAQLWLEAMGEVDRHYSDNRSWLSIMPEFVERIFDLLSGKRLELLRAESEFLVTCDHPVAIDYQQGFVSEVFFPVGSHTAVLFHGVGERSTDSGLHVPVTTISPSDVRSLNLRTIQSAENELYAAVSSTQISEQFNRIPKPERFPAIEASEILGLLKAK